MPSIFTQIIEGKALSYKIFEDEYTIAFLSREAIQLGHALVVPKIEVDYFLDVPEPYYSAVFRNAKKLAKAIHEATDCKRIGTIIAGWDIPHFHYHLVPMFNYDDLNPKKGKERSPEENQVIQRKIVERLKE